jgi:hypothetical protein
MSGGTRPLENLYSRSLKRCMQLCVEGRSSPPPLHLACDRCHPGTSVAKLQTPLPRSADIPPERRRTNKLWRQGTRTQNPSPNQNPQAHIAIAILIFAVGRTQEAQPTACFETYSPSSPQTVDVVHLHFISSPTQRLRVRPAAKAPPVRK